MVDVIIVHTRVRCRPQHRARLAEILRGFATATRAEDGCLAYSYAADVVDDCLFLGVEEWRDAAALNAHVAAPHMNDPDSGFDTYSLGSEVVRVFTAEPLDW